MPYRRPSILAPLLGLVLALWLPLTAAEPLRLGTDDWPPYEYRDPASGRVVGFATELVAAVLARLDTELAPVEIYPWARVERDALEGALDGLFTLTATPARRQQLAFPDEPLYIDRGALFVRRATPPQPLPNQLVDLAGLSLGVVRGYAYSPEILALLADSERVIEVADETQLFRLLARGRVEAVLTYRSVGLAMLRRLGLEGELLALDQPALFEARYFVAFNRRRVDPQFVERFSAELAAYKRSPAYRALWRRYLHDGEATQIDAGP